MHTQPLGAGVVKRSTRLADGRELIYFDDPGTTLGPDRAVDTRTLDPRPATATMRQDVLTGDWVSVAAARQNRAFLPPAELDPLAPQTPTNPSEVPSAYDVAVFENRSPSFGPALAEATGDAPAASDPPHGLDDLAKQLLCALLRPLPLLHCAPSLIALVSGSACRSLSVRLRRWH